MIADPTPPDFVERRVVGEGIDDPLHRGSVERMKERGVTWARFTYLPERDEIFVEGWLVRPADEGPEPRAAAMSETREHRPDDTAEQRSEREGVEGHVAGVEQAVDKGLLSRRQAERVIGAGQKAHRSHDMARGIGQKE